MANYTDKFVIRVSGGSNTVPVTTKTNGSAATTPLDNQKYWAAPAIMSRLCWAPVP